MRVCLTILSGKDEREAVSACHRRARPGNDNGEAPRGFASAPDATFDELAALQKRQFLRARFLLAVGALFHRNFIGGGDLARALWLYRRRLRKRRHRNERRQYDKRKDARKP
jgi:hypothetical protein